MAVWRQIRNPNALHGQDYLGRRLLNRDDKLSRTISVSGKPIEHERIGIAVVGIPGSVAGRVAVPVRVTKALGTHMEWITPVEVLEWRLSERKEQAGCDAQIEYATHR